MFARTPEPPYVAVLFTNRRTPGDEEAYGRYLSEAFARDNEPDVRLSVAER